MSVTVIGKCKFPITAAGSFRGTLSAVATKQRVHGITYLIVKPMGVDGSQVFIDTRLMVNPNTILAVISSFQALASDNLLSSATFLHVEGEFASISGASEGIAVFLALLGKVCPDHMCFTGYVAALGASGSETIENLIVMPVDCVPEKVDGAVELGMTIVISSQNATGLTRTNDPYNTKGKWIAVTTVRDILQLL